MPRSTVIGRLAAVVVLAGATVIASAGPVAAECSYIPPLPKVSMAIGTAKELFVGDVIANGLWNNAPVNTRFTVQVVEVLRGPAKVGDHRTFDWVTPNWPWTKGTGTAPAYPACTYLTGRVGETVILALDARTSGGTLHAYGATWYQPPTTFSTVGIVNGSSREQYGSNGRQLFSLNRLRELARLSLPATDTASTAIAPSSSRSVGDARLALVTLLALVAGLAALRRTRRSR